MFNISCCEFIVNIFRKKSLFVSNVSTWNVTDQNMSCYYQKLQELLGLTVYIFVKLNRKTVSRKYWLFNRWIKCTGFTPVKSRIVTGRFFYRFFAGSLKSLDRPVIGRSDPVWKNRTDSNSASEYSDKNIDWNICMLHELLFYIIYSYHYESEKSSTIYGYSQ